MLNRVKKYIINRFFSRKIRPFDQNRVMDDKSIESFHLLAHEVAVHFNSPLSSIYQLEQWIPILRELDKSIKVVIITRRKSTFEWLVKNTEFSVIFTHTQKDLVNTFEENDFKCILYVNHGVHNFQSLAYRNALHVHINHGESEKTSTLSNQANAYNYVFIVAKGAYDKYNLNLLEKDMSKFIEIGRPQLEHIPPIPPFDTNREVILYAPTWEGTHNSMNYSSLDIFGLSIINQILNEDRYYLLYKPHPNTGFNDNCIKKINQEIIDKLNKNPNAKVIKSGDINSLYTHVDMAIFDNSAVAIDYLNVDKPMIMTDIFYRAVDRQSKPMIIKACTMLTSDNSSNLIEIIDRELKEDTIKSDRAEIKEYVLGKNNYQKGESTQKFISTVKEIIQKRDRLLDELKRYE